MNEAKDMFLQYCNAEREASKLMKADLPPNKTKVKQQRSDQLRRQLQNEPNMECLDEFLGADMTFFASEFFPVLFDSSVTSNPLIASKLTAGIVLNYPSCIDKLSQVTLPPGAPLSDILRYLTAATRIACHGYMWPGTQAAVAAAAAKLPTAIIHPSPPVALSAVAAAKSSTRWNALPPPDAKIVEALQGAKEMVGEGSQYWATLEAVQYLAAALNSGAGLKPLSKKSFPEGRRGFPYDEVLALIDKIRQQYADAYNQMNKLLNQIASSLADKAAKGEIPPPGAADRLDLMREGMSLLHPKLSLALAHAGYEGEIAQSSKAQTVKAFDKDFLAKLYGDEATSAVYTDFNNEAVSRYLGFNDKCLELTVVKGKRPQDLITCEIVVEPISSLLNINQELVEELCSAAGLADALDKFRAPARAFRSRSDIRSFRSTRHYADLSVSSTRYYQNVLPDLKDYIRFNPVLPPTLLGHILASLARRHSDIAIVKNIVASFLAPVRGLFASPPTLPSIADLGNGTHLIMMLVAHTCELMKFGFIAPDSVSLLIGNLCSMVTMTPKNCNVLTPALCTAIRFAMHYLSVHPATANVIKNIQLKLVEALDHYPSTSRRAQLRNTIIEAGLVEVEYVEVVRLTTDSQERSVNNIMKAVNAICAPMHVRVQVNNHTCTVHRHPTGIVIDLPVGATPNNHGNGGNADSSNNNAIHVPFGKLPKQFKQSVVQISNSNIYNLDIISREISALCNSPGNGYAHATSLILQASAEHAPALVAGAVLAAGAGDRKAMALIAAVAAGVQGGVRYPVPENMIFCPTVKPPRVDPLAKPAQNTALNSAVSLLAHGLISLSTIMTFVIAPSGAPDGIHEVMNRLAILATAINHVIPAHGLSELRSLVQTAGLAVVARLLPSATSYSLRTRLASIADTLGAAPATVAQIGAGSLAEVPQAWRQVSLPAPGSGVRLVAGRPLVDAIYTHQVQRECEPEPEPEPEYESESEYEDEDEDEDYEQFIYEDDETSKFNEASWLRKFDAKIQPATAPAPAPAAQAALASLIALKCRK